MKAREKKAAPGLTMARVPSEQYKRLRALAVLSGAKVTDLIAAALDDFLKKRGV
ncbi:MAG: hypothetical protein AB7O37_20590 [Vicinamibacteria bacterium]